jgi:hypothetical protein
METENDNKKYNVSRYFDTYFEGIVKSSLTKEEANHLAEKLNKDQPRTYVEYLVREE